MARLFTKNVAKRSSERISMLGEVCPVVVSKRGIQPVEGPSNGGPNYEALKVERCLTAYINVRRFEHHGVNSDY
jgi:hypothetical protein